MKFECLQVRNIRLIFSCIYLYYNDNNEQD